MEPSGSKNVTVLIAYETPSASILIADRKKRF